MEGSIALLTFLAELEKLKSVLRKNAPTGLDRRENSAEHSWHVTVAAMLFAELSPGQVDVLKVLKMMLIHDVVEIDAGDVLIFDDAARAANEAVEQAAARRLFGLLPERQGAELLSLWEEFEAAESAEARFAKGVDRVLPVMQNLAQNGGSWVTHGISRARVIDKVSGIEDVSPGLWRLLRRQLDDAPFWNPVRRELRVVPYDQGWAGAFEAESEWVRGALGPNLRRLHHIGSTSIGPKMFAKPIVDMLGEVDDIDSVEGAAQSIASRGWEYLGEYGIPGRRYLRRIDDQGIRSHHLHIFVAGDAHVSRHLAFRDYLREHAADAKRYSDLKRKLAAHFPDDIEAYMDGKDELIKALEAKALAWHTAK